LLNQEARVLPRGRIGAVARRGREWTGAPEAMICPLRPAVTG
jgi:hypothetical protein